MQKSAQRSNNPCQHQHSYFLSLWIQSTTLDILSNGNGDNHDDNHNDNHASGQYPVHWRWQHLERATAQTAVISSGRMACGTPGGYPLTRIQRGCTLPTMARQHGRRSASTQHGVTAVITKDRAVCVGGEFQCFLAGCDEKDPDFTWPIIEYGHLQYTWRASAPRYG